MAQGTVKWFNTQKGYGFINPDEGESDVFVHITAVQNSGLNGLNEGQKVTYELEEQRNGKMAAVGLGLVDWSATPLRKDKRKYTHMFSMMASKNIWWPFLVAIAWGLYLCL